MPNAPDRVPFRAVVRRAVLVSALAVAAFAAVHGSTGAQPGPDDDPNYHDPMWIYANPAADVSAQAGRTVPIGDEHPPVEPGRGDPHPLGEDLPAGGR